MYRDEYTTRLERLKALIARHVAKRALTSRMKLSATLCDVRGPRYGRAINKEHAAYTVYRREHGTTSGKRNIDKTALLLYYNTTTGNLVIPFVFLSDNLGLRYKYFQRSVSSLTDKNGKYSSFCRDMGVLFYIVRLVRTRATF